MKALNKLTREFLWRVEGFTDTKGMFFHGRYIVRYWISNDSASVEVYNPKKNIYLINVAEHLEQSYEVPDEESEWSCNGFRNEFDYLNYKFG